MTAAVSGTIFEVQASDQSGDEVRSTEDSVLAEAGLDGASQEVGEGQVAVSSRRYKNRLYQTITSMKTKPLSNLEIQGQLVKEQEPDQQDQLERANGFTSHNLAATNGGAGSLSEFESTTKPKFSGEASLSTLNIPSSGFSPLSKPVKGFSKARLEMIPPPSEISDGDFKTVTILEIQKNEVTISISGIDGTFTESDGVSIYLNN